MTETGDLQQYTTEDIRLLLVQEMDNGNDERSIYEALVGTRLLLLRFVQERVAEDDIESLNTLCYSNTPLHDLIKRKSDTISPGPGQPPFNHADVPQLNALRALAALGLALVDDEAAAQDHLTVVLRWFDCAQIFIATSAALPHRNWDTPHTTRLDALRALLEGEQMGYAALVWVAYLDGAALSGGTLATIETLLDLGVTGQHATLSARVLRGLPSTPIPDPEAMAFFSADSRFSRGLRTAWGQASRRHMHGTVLWKLTDPVGPIDQIADISLTAAFTVVFDEIRRVGRRIVGPFTVRRIAAKTAVVGGVDGNGCMVSVDGYGAKLTAADRIDRIIVPQPDIAKAQGNRHGMRAEIVGVDTWRRAASASRRRSPEAVRRVLALSFVLALIGAGAGVWAYLSAARAESHQQAVSASARLAARSEALGNLDPVLARLEAVAAWRLDPSSAQARYAMQSAASLPGIAVLGDSGAGKVTTMAFSPDGRILAVGTGPGVAGAVGEQIPGAKPETGVVQLWDNASHVPLGRALAVAGAGAIMSVAFSPDGKLLAVGSTRGGTQLWNVADRQLVAVLPADQGYEVNSVAFSPNGKTLAAGFGFNLNAAGSVSGALASGIQLWDVATHRQDGPPLSANGSDIIAVAFSPDGKTLASGTIEDNVSTLLWNPATHQQIGALPNIDDTYAIAFSPNGKIIATAGKSGAELWDSATSRQITTLASAPYGVFVDSVAFSADGNTLAVARDGIAQLWDVSGRRQIGANLSGAGAGSVDRVAFSDDGKTLAVGTSIGAETWNAAALIGSPPPGFRVLGDVRSLAFGPDDTTIAVGSEGEARLWDTGTRQPRSTLVADRIGGFETALSSDGKTAAVGEPAATVPTWLWHLTTRREVTLPTATGTFALAFSPDNSTLAIGTGDGTRLWNVTTGRQFATLATGGAPIESVAFSPNASMLVTSDGSHLQFWDVASRKPVGAPISVSGTYVVAFSPDGQTVAVATLAGTELFDATTHQAEGLPLPTGIAFSTTWSPDGSVVAAATIAGTQLWNVATRQQVGPLLPSDEAVALAWSPDGKTLAAGTTGGAVLLWNVNYLVPARTLSLLCQQAGHSLTPTQWSQYAPGVPYQNVCP